jgi:hypothetical protein
MEHCEQLKWASHERYWGSATQTLILTSHSPVVNIYATGFNIQQFYILPTQFIYVFCVDLRTNSDHFPIQNCLTGVYNRDGVCLLRGTDWVFTYSSG